MDFMRTGRLDTWQAHATARALGLSGISSKASTPPPIIFPPFPLPLHTPLPPPPPPPPPPPVQRGRCFRFPRPRWDSDDCDDDEDDDDDDDNGGGGWGIVKRSRPGLPSPSLAPMHHVWVLNNSESYGDLSAFALLHPPPPPPLLAPPRIPVASPESSQTIGTATVASRILQQQQQARPSVIVCAPASSRDSAHGGTQTAPRKGGMDAREGRPGGVRRPGWQRALPRPPPQSPPQSPPAPQSSPPAADLTAPMERATSVAGSVDDHFRQSLGDLWLQIKATESASPPTSASPLTSLSPPASV